MKNHVMMVWVDRGGFPEDSRSVQYFRRNPFHCAPVTELAQFLVMKGISEDVPKVVHSLKPEVIPTIIESEMSKGHTDKKGNVIKHYKDLPPTIKSIVSGLIGKRLVQIVFEELGYEVIRKEEFFGMNAFRKKYKFDLSAIKGDNKIYVEAKTQTVAGSMDSKLFFALESIKLIDSQLCV